MPARPAPVRVAIVGTGGMAHAHAQAFAAIPGCRLVAACDIDAARVNAFGDAYDIAGRHVDLDAMLAQRDIDAVSVVTPDSFHLPVTLRALESGRHVLCEKPLALTAADARRMFAAAEAANVRHMVNFTYRNWPCIQAVQRAVARGDIGEIRHVEASYLQAWLPSTIWGDWRTSPQWLWRLSTAHGSRGVLGDVGVHIVDFATFPAGPIREVFCRLRAFDKAPENRVGEYVLDANDSAVMTVEFANGALGVIHTSRWVGGHANRLFLKIAGTAGTIEIDSEHSTTSYRVSRGRGLAKCQWREVPAAHRPTVYERFIRSIRTGKPDQPDFARGAEIQAVLDACVESDRTGRPVVLP